MDIGGNKIDIGLVRGNKIIKTITFKTKKTKKALLNQICDAIKLILGGQTSKIKGIGIGVASPVLNGVVLNPPNLPLKNFNLQKYLRSKFKVKVKVENDVNCYALAELKYGFGKKLNNFVFVTIGTGIGGAIVFNKKLYISKGSAGEVGHIIISDSRNKCGAGHFGCFESMASGKALLKLSKEKMGKEYLAKELVLMARRGNKKARLVIDSISKYLGKGFVSIANMFDPDAIIVSGGVVEAGNMLFSKARIILRKNSMGKTKLLISEIEKGALLGAATLIK